MEESDGIHYYQEGKDLRNAGYSLDGYWYYFDADGVMKQNSFRQKNGQSFYYDGGRTSCTERGVGHQWKAL